jgi:plastocyanin
MSKRVSISAGLVLFAIGEMVAIAWASESHRIIQKDRSFQVDDNQIKDIAVAAGDELRFLNDDNFLHQIFIASGGLDFDSNEQVPGAVIAIKFSDPGIYEIRCHIHPKMSLTVTVK